MKNYIFVVGLSEFAARMNFMALSMLILSFPNAAWYLTAFFIVRQVGGIFGSLYAGNIVDRYDRKKIMLLSDVVNGFAVLLPVIFHHPIAICLSAFILGCTYQLFYVSYSSSIPDMFGQDNSAKINGLIVRIASIVSIIGFIIGGYITEFFGHVPVILFDSFTYLIAGIYLTKLHWNASPKQMNEEGDSTSLFSVFKQNKIIALVVLTGFFYALAVSANNYSLPMLATKFELESLTNGLFWSIASLGAFIGTFFHMKNKSIFHYLISLFIFGVSMVLVFIESDHYIWIVMFLFIGGGFEGFSQVLVKTILQKVPSNARGKAFSLQGLSSRLGFFGGFLLCPIIVQSFSITVNTLWLNGILLIWIIFVFIFIIFGARKWKKQSIPF